MCSIPPSLYRVQHDKSYTIFERTNGFESQGHYLMAYSLWLDRRQFVSHLHWGDRPAKPSPLISVFDNLSEATTRAHHHIHRGDTGVILAEIDASSLKATSLDIEFADRVVHLPVWENEERMTFIPTQTIREHLEVPVNITQTSEWFALDYIPYNMIRSITHY